MLCDDEEVGPVHTARREEGGGGMAILTWLPQNVLRHFLVTVAPIPILTILQTPHPAGLGRHPHSLCRRRGVKRGGMGMAYSLVVTDSQRMRIEDGWPGMAGRGDR